MIDKNRLNTCISYLANALVTRPESANRVIQIAREEYTDPELIELLDMLDVCDLSDWNKQDELASWCDEQPERAVRFLGVAIRGSLAHWQIVELRSKGRVRP